MNLFVRWCKFNIVGAMGMAVQLCALSLFVRWMHSHYLAATAVAIELTLVHNFVWHLQYTWRDGRCSPDGPLNSSVFICPMAWCRCWAILR